MLVYIFICKYINIDAKFGTLSIGYKGDYMKIIYFLFLILISCNKQNENPKLSTSQVYNSRDTLKVGDIIISNENEYREYYESDTTFIIKKSDSLFGIILSKNEQGMC